MKTKFIVILAVFMIVASEGVGRANNVCWEMMVSSLKGEHLLFKDNPDTVGDYVKNTLFFPLGLIASATAVTISPIAMVFAPSECFETNDPEARERLREIERSSFSMLQQMNNQFQSSSGSSSYSGASGMGTGTGCNFEGNDFGKSRPGAVSGTNFDGTPCVSMHEEAEARQRSTPAPTPIPSSSSYTGPARATH